jgi:hypothetical protein
MKKELKNQIPCVTGRLGWVISGMPFQSGPPEVELTEDQRTITILFEETNPLASSAEAVRDVSEAPTKSK